MRDGRIAGARGRPGRGARRRRERLHARCPGSSTATRTCRSPAGARGEYERKLRGDPYEEIARAGGGIAASARALRESSDEAVLAQSRALAREMLAAGTTAFECKSGYGLSREGELRALRARRRARRGRADDDLDGAARARGAPRPHRRALDGRGRGDAAGGRRAAGSVTRARHLRRVDRLRQRAPRAAWARSRAAPACDLRCHVEQLSTMRSVPVAIAAGARSVDHLSRIHPDDVGAARRGATCAAVLLPGAEFLGRRAARARARAARRRARSSCSRPTSTPAPRRSLSLPLVIGLARAPVRAEHARGARGGDAQRGLDARPRSASAARSSSASAPTSCCSTGRPSRSPTASAATRSPRRSSTGGPCTCAPDAAVEDRDTR